MSKQKRGGSRLEKNMSENRQHTHPGQSSAPHRSKKRPGAKGGLPRWARILLVVLAVLVAILLILFTIYKLWAVLPDVDDLGAEVTVDPETGILPSQNPMVNAPRKEKFYTFLVAGRDTGGGGNTDTMMLVAYDIPNQKLSVMSLPRDTMVDARHPDRNRKLNGVWNLGLYYAKKDNKKAGVEYLKEAVGDMVGFMPDFYVVVNWEAFGRLVTALGGVEFEVPFDMKYDDPTQNLHINVAKGKRVLTGEEAMGVVRWRHNNSFSVGYASGDLGRIQTQQALMKEVVKKCLKIENATKIAQFAEIFTEEVDTDLTLGNLVAFAERAIFGGLSMDNVLFVTMPNEPVYVGSDSYVQAKPQELLGILNDSFNPYKDDLPMDALHVLQYKSSTGYYTYTGTGTGTAPVYTAPKPASVVTKPEATATPLPENSDDPDADSTDRPETSARPSGGNNSDASARPSGSNAPDASAHPLASAVATTDEPRPSASQRPDTTPPTHNAEPPVSGEDQPAGIPMD